MFGHKRRARLEQYKKLHEATQQTKSAQKLNWDLNRPQGVRKVNRQTAGMEAVQMVREVLAGFVWPTQPQLQYGGLRRTTAGLDDKNAETGVITVSGTVRTATGVTLGFDVPIEIRNGHLLEPCVMFHNGTPIILSQSGVSGMIQNATTYGDLPIRSQYSPPLTRDEEAARQSPRLERRTPGMFHMAGQALREFIRSGGRRNLNGLTKAAQRKTWEDYDPATWGQPAHTAPGTARGLDLETPAPRAPGVGHDPNDPLAPGRESGFCPGCYRDVAADPQFAPYCSQRCFATSRRAPSVPRRGQMQSEDPDVHLYSEPERPSKDQLSEEDTLDGAEREPEKMSMPGARVRVNKKLSAPTRGGPREIINSGTTGTVIRDQGGDGVNLYIQLDDGRKAVIPVKYLTSSRKKKGSTENF